MGEEDHSVHDPSLSSFISSIWASPKYNYMAAGYNRPIILRACIYICYTNPAFLLSSFFFFFFHPAGSMRNVLTIEIFATRAITSWKSTFTISFTKGSCDGTIKIKDVVFPLLFFWKRIQRMFWKKKKWKFRYLFRIPRWIKLLLVFHPCADSIWCVFLFSSWKLEE